MRIIDDLKLDFKDVLIVPKRSKSISRSMINLERAITFPRANKQAAWKGVPIIAANMDTVATFSMARALAKHKCMTALHKHYSVEELSNFFNGESEAVTQNVFYTLGVSDDDISKLQNVMKETHSIKNICVDAANGYTEYYVERVHRIRELCPNVLLMAGNVTTPEMTEQLILSGADICKINIGSGACCLTRKIAGVGYPAISACVECSDAAHGLNGYICMDGGCTCPGDVSKYVCAGSDFIMIGGMLAGTDECEQEIITKRYLTNELDENNERIIEEKKFCQTYGMSSKTAMEKHNGGMATYKASEGKTVLVPYKGRVENVVQDIMGGLRSCATYIGAMKIKDMPKCATFVKTHVQENQVFGKE